MEQYKGKTVEEILQEIAAKANCKVEDITYNVIEEKKGILGIGNSVTIEAYTPEDIKEFIFNYLGNYYIGINQGVKIEITVNDGDYKVNVNADNNAVAIGRGGQTLQATNTVLRAACNAEFKKRVNVTVDVNHYKDDRYRKVKQIAKRTALDVRKNKVDAALDPMPADERKVIHQYLSDFKNIKTESEGEGRERHLVIKYTEE